MYRQINLIDKSYVDAYLNAGILLLEKKEYTAALEQFNLLVANNPLNPKGYFYRAYTNKLIGKIEAAKIDLQNALNLNPDYEEAQSLMRELSENN